MGKDRIVILTSVGLMVVLLIGAASLMPRINYMRADLQLTAHEDVIENMPPEIAFTQAALGSFRGIAVDILWGRVQRMQQEGKLYEAMQLADWITKLQPRFSQVWVFHAWNMSYNISVTTHTPQERWMWVQAGIKLLRDEAIPLNPNSLQLYRQLGYMYLHKIGEYSDDMHRVYKRQLAMEWHLVLGDPPRGGTVQDVVDWFEPIAVMYEAYVNERELGFAVREELDRLAADEDLAELVEGYRPLMIDQLNTRLRGVMAAGGERAEKLAQLRELVQAQLAEARRDPLERLRAGDSEVAAQLDRLAEHGFEPDHQLLQLVAQLEARRTSVDLELAGVEQPELRDDYQWLMNWLTNDALEDVRTRLLAFVRAKVISETFKMNPIWMHELMRGEWLVTADQPEAMPLPIDWRHPGAHAMYWSSLGVRRAEGLLTADDNMILNTDRQVVHSIQSLKRSGNMTFDLATRSLRALPDPRYIDPHHVATYGAQDRISGEYVTSAAPESFKAGHENFLTTAVQQAYFYGDEAQARRYYRMLRDLYGDFRPDRAQRYQQPMEDFVLSYLLQDELFSLDNAREIVTGLTTQAIAQGYANGEREAANRFLRLARRAHSRYQQQRLEIGSSQFSGEAEPMMLPEFEEMLTDSFRNYVTEQPDLLASARAWRNAPAGLKRRVFDDVSGSLRQRAQQAGYRPNAMFPEPGGMAAYRAARGEQQQEEDGDEATLEALPQVR